MLVLRTLSDGTRECQCRGCGCWLPHTSEHFSPRAPKIDLLKNICKTCQPPRIQKRDPDYQRVRKALARAKCRGLLATISLDDWHKAVVYFGRCCAYCGKGGELIADHFIPLSSRDCPGSVPFNILPACLDCNRHKGKTAPAIWLERRFGPARATTVLAEVAAWFDRSGGDE